VLLEKVTGTWCPPCGTLSPTIDKIWEYFGSTKLAIIEYHNGATSGPYYDPFATTETNGKASYYGVTGVPTVIIDGDQANMIVGVYDYTTYSDAINASLAIAREFTINVSGTISSGSVTVHLEQTDPSSATNLKMRYAVLESEKYYSGGTDPDDIYNHICRKIVTEDAVTLPVPSGGVDYTKTFTVDPGWDSAKLSFVAYLQEGGSTPTTKKVHQACFYGYGSANVPEISPLFILPMGGAFVALVALACRKRKE
jgi:hypothetical protein